MARPQLPIGTWGNIRREQLGPRSWRARARFRDYDRVTRDVEASGATGAAAERSLRIKLRDRSTPNDDEITGDARIHRLAVLWLDEITAEQGRCSAPRRHRSAPCREEIEQLRYDRTKHHVTLRLTICAEAVCTLTYKIHALDNRETVARSP